MNPAHASERRHDRRTVAVYEVAAREAVAVALDDAEELVAEHQRVAARRSYAEDALGDLAVGAADADLQGAEEDLALGRRGSGTSATAVLCGWSGMTTRPRTLRPLSIRRR